MTSLCAYRDIFGAPNTGAHSYRVFSDFHGGFAIVDFIFTILGAILIGQFIGFTRAFAFLIVLSIILHFLFCVPTTTNLLLGLGGK
jgi:hypothetical protein